MDYVYLEFEFINDELETNITYKNHIHKPIPITAEQQKRLINAFDEIMDYFK